MSEKSNSSFDVRLVFFLVAGVFLLIGFNANIQEQNRVAQIKASEEKANFSIKCFKIGEKTVAEQAGNVGSSSRQQAVDTFYEKVLTSPCVIWGDGTILTNPFENINSTDSKFIYLQRAYRQSLLGWNGVEPFTNLRCADGWVSPSIGKSGACSHHGGVAEPFQNDTKYQLGSAMQKAGMRVIYEAESSENLLKK